MKQLRTWIASVLAVLLVSGLNAAFAETPAEAATAIVTAPAMAAEPAPMIIFNRQIFVFRASFLGIAPDVRAKRSVLRIKEILDESGAAHRIVDSMPIERGGIMLSIDGSLAFVVTPGDVDVLSDKTIEDAAKSAVKALQQVVDETAEARNLKAMLVASGYAALATLIVALVAWGLLRFQRWLRANLLILARKNVDQITIAGATVVDNQNMRPLIDRLITLLFRGAILILAYEWLSIVLARFPYTRPWGEELNHYLLSVIGNLAVGMLHALPGLGVAIIIFLIARFFIGLLSSFFERATQSSHPVSWLDRETMPTTRRLVAVGVWLFALAMAYPYLPGAETDAFKGLSVLLGLMISLGASSVVGQGAAGLILTYSRNIRVGEYVRIGDHEGTVVQMGLFTTRVRTGMGEELTLPNSMITASVTKNYSRAVIGRGYVIDTVVTIGYDTPWRQVEAMLLEAADRTQDILKKPAPHVFQTALSDYYPEYRLVAQAVPEVTHPRADVLSRLHANIQDVFNEYGVQIMSPNYRGDPAQEKLVPPDRWYSAPAKKPNA